MKLQQLACIDITLRASYVGSTGHVLFLVVCPRVYVCLSAQTTEQKLKGLLW